MITFRHVTDSLGEALFFQIDGREAGLVAQDLDGSYYVYFADIADAPRGVAIERATDPCSKGAFVNGYASEDDALALVYRTYGDDTPAPEPQAVTFHPRQGHYGIGTVYEILIADTVRGQIFYSAHGGYVVQLRDYRDAQGHERLECFSDGDSVPGYIFGFSTLDDAMACVLELFATPIPARADSRVASRVPSASAPVVIHTPFPASTGAAFYPQPLPRPRLDAQRHPTTPTRNTQ